MFLDSRNTSWKVRTYPTLIRKEPKDSSTVRLRSTESTGLWNSGFKKCQEYSRFPSFRRISCLRCSCCIPTLGGLSCGQLCAFFGQPIATWCLGGKTVDLWWPMVTYHLDVAIDIHWWEFSGRPSISSTEFDLIGSCCMLLLWTDPSKIVFHDRKSRPADETAQVCSQIQGWHLKESKPSTEKWMVWNSKQRCI